MNMRHAIHAGGFYEASAGVCRDHAAKLCDSVDLPDDLPEDLRGGLVPHAGWVYSGKLAAMTFKALAAGRCGETFVLLGADHTGTARRGEVYDTGAWLTPLGEVAIDEDLAAALLGGGDCLRANPDAHAREHSIEVQVPLLQVVCPQARIVPIAVPPTDLAVEIGQTVGRTLAGDFPDVRVVGSTDLTHDGVDYCRPGGPGPRGVEWAVENDRRMLDLIEVMEADKIIPEADARGNACGAGAIAAAIAACAAQGATKGICLAYTNCYEVLRRMDPNHADETTVGYASVVFA
jgi:hypothetical protein